MLLRGDADLDAWIRSMNFQRWILQDLAAGQIIGSMPFANVPAFAMENRLNGAEVITTIEARMGHV